VARRASYNDNQPDFRAKTRGVAALHGATGAITEKAISYQMTY